jgi:WD40 repeat protein
MNAAAYNASIASALLLATLAGCRKDASPSPPASASAPASLEASAVATARLDAGAAKILRLRPRSEAHVAMAQIRYVAWDPSGRRLATTCGPGCPPVSARGGGVVLWSFPELEQVGGLDGTGKDPDDGSEGSPMAPLFVAGGRRLVAGSMWHVLTWSLPDGKRIADTELGAVEGNVFASPDGMNVIALTTFGVLALFDAETGKERLEFTARRSEMARLAEVRWSRDGAVAVTADEAGPVDLWDLHTGKRRTIADPGTAAGVDISPVSDRFALALGDGRVQLYGLPRAEPRRLLSRGVANPSRDWTAGVVFSADGKLLAIHARGGEISVWDLDKAAVEPALTAKGSADASLVRFSAYGQLLVWPATVGFTVWDGSSSAPPRALGDGVVSAMAWIGPTLLLVGTADATELWDVAAGSRRWRYARGAPVEDDLQLSSDGRWLALADGDLHLVRLADGHALAVRSYVGERRGMLSVDEQTGRFDGDEARAREDLVDAEGVGATPDEVGRQREPGLVKSFLVR